MFAIRLGGSIFNDAVVNVGRRNNYREAAPAASRSVIGLRGGKEVVAALPARLCFLTAGVLTMLVGCSTSRWTAAPNDLPANDRAQPFTRNGQYLYVANYGNGFGALVTVYAPLSTTMVRVLKPSDAYYSTFEAPCALALDSSKNLYVGWKFRNVFAFHRGTTTVARSIDTGTRPHCSLALDASGNLYLTNLPDYYYTNGSVTVYAPSGTKPAATITNGIDQPNALAVDAAENLYVSNAGSNTVTVYSLGATTAKITIAKGIASPRALAIDPKTGDLYVANDGIWDRNRFVRSSIAVYAAGSTTPSRTISTGIDAPDALTIDAKGNLYVANDPPLSSAPGSLSVYAADSARPVRTILNGIDKPTAVVVDGAGNVYVANGRAHALGSVAEYTSGSTVPARTIVTDVYDPTSLVLSSQ